MIKHFTFLMWLSHILTLILGSARRPLVVIADKVLISTSYQNRRVMRITALLFIHWQTIHNINTVSHRLS